MRPNGACRCDTGATQEAHFLKSPICETPAYPAFGRVRADPRGRIWINPYFDHLHWYVIDSAGSRISLVNLPLPEDQQPQLVGFADESVVIRHVDESGGAQLSLYRVETR